MSLSSTVSFRGLGGDGGATPCNCFGRKGYFVGMYCGTFSECVKVLGKFAYAILSMRKGFTIGYRHGAGAGVFTRTI